MKARFYVDLVLTMAVVSAGIFITNCYQKRNKVTYPEPENWIATGSINSPTSINGWFMSWTNGIDHPLSVSEWRDGKMVRELPVLPEGTSTKLGVGWVRVKETTDFPTVLDTITGIKWRFENGRWKEIEKP